MKYRKEIDGLRALAILPVLLFHAEFQAFSGGFVGVDIFFVISGYLITKIIVGDILADRFSVADFYQRRIRRIAPVLTLILLISSVLSWFLLLPRDMKSFSESLLSVIFSFLTFTLSVPVVISMKPPN